MSGSAINVGAFAFQNLKKLDSVSLDALSVSIGANAFDGCTILPSIDLSNDTTFTTIGDNAFSDCTTLAGFVNGTTTIGGSTTAAIGRNAFRFCPLQLGFIKEINVSNPTLHLFTDYVFGGAFGTYAYVAPNNFILGLSQLINTGSGCLLAGTISQSLLVGVQAIGTAAFAYCGGLVSIDLSNIRTIGNQAFRCCRFLTNITSPTDGFISVQYYSLVETFALSSKIIFASSIELTEIGNRILASSGISANGPQIEFLGSYNQYDSLQNIDPGAFYGLNTPEKGHLWATDDDTIPNKTN
jgi:hypothetical protein